MSNKDKHETAHDLAELERLTNPAQTAINDVILETEEEAPAAKPVITSTPITFKDAFSTVTFIVRPDAQTRKKLGEDGLTVIETTRKAADVLLEICGSGNYLKGVITRFRKPGMPKAGLRFSFMPYDDRSKSGPVVTDTDEGREQHAAAKDAILRRFLVFCAENNVDLSAKSAATVQYAVEGEDLI